MFTNWRVDHPRLGTHMVQFKKRLKRNGFFNLMSSKHPCAADLRKATLKTCCAIGFQQWCKKIAHSPAHGSNFKCVGHIEWQSTSPRDERPSLTGGANSNLDATQSFDLFCTAAACTWKNSLVRCDRPTRLYNRLRRRPKEIDTATGFFTCGSSAHSTAVSRCTH